MTIRFGALLLLVIIINSLSWHHVFSESTNYKKPPFSCDSSNLPTNSLPFCNTNLTIKDRVLDLVSRLTLEEKISQLVNTAPAIPRLNISAYQWWSEALHGVSRHGKGTRFNGTLTSATVFPQVILTAASFDVNLWYRIGQAIGKEARAFYNEGQSLGMTFWAPNINIFRDPRWGRGQETAGEDPYVASGYAISFVRGIEGGSLGQDFGVSETGDRVFNPKFLQASACCKHYTAHDLDNWNGVNRFIFDANVTKQDMADTFQPPFKNCVEIGKASGLMCAYNRINGVPNCADYDLLTKTVREKWGFTGYIASDCDAVRIIHEEQGYAKTPEDAVAQVLKAGMDVNCGSYLMRYTKSAIEKNLLLESEVDRALHNLFSIRMRLGLFNGNPNDNEYGTIRKEQVCSKEHQDLALEVARDGIVLLKNSDNLLPLPKDKNISIAVIGPNANKTEVFSGNYEGLPCKNVTILQAVQSYVKSAVYIQGCDSVNCTSVSMAEALDVAKAADYVLLVMGLDQSQEREKHDRTDLILPGKQENVIKDIARAAKRPIVLVILSGGPVDISFAKDDLKVGSILWAGYPGEAGGIALSQIVFGDHNPGGRLPVTWYPQDFIDVPMTDMRMRPENSTGYPGRTYRFYRGTKVFEFGYGLSFTNYTYEFVHVSQDNLHLHQSTDTRVKKSGATRYILVSELTKEFCNNKSFSVQVAVNNLGKMAGKHPVLLYAREANLTNGSPIKKLIGFQAVMLGTAERVELKFTVNPCEHLSKANKDGIEVIEEGTLYLIVNDKEYPINVVLQNN